MWLSSRVNRPHRSLPAFWILFLTAVGMCSPVLRGQEMPSIPTSPLPATSDDLNEGVFLTSRLLREAQSSMVQVYWRGREQTERSSGFVVSNGMIVSVRRSAKVSEDVVLRKNGMDHDAEVLLVDTNSGIVLIQANPDGPEIAQPVRMGSSRGFYIGDALFTVGLDSTGRANRCLMGMMVGRDRRVAGDRLPVAYMRAQVPEALPSGGLPILESSGKVVAVDLGLNLEDKGEFHALPIEVISKLVADLEKFGKREEAWIGVTFNTGTTTPKVVSVRPNSPGDRAGILPGDIVINFAGARIDTLDDLADTCYCLSPGRETEIHILRGITSVKRRLQPVSLSSKPVTEGEATTPIP